MFDLATLSSFIGVSILLMLTPGPDIIFTLTQGLSNGRKAGVTVALGLACGNFVHTLGVALGLSVVFETSQLAFWIVKLLGAAYLVYLAFLSLKHRKADIQDSTENREVKTNLFRKGFIMNVLNPKVAIFFLAFLPRFVSPDKGSLPLQFIILGSIFVFFVAIVFGSVGFFAGSLGSLFLKNKGFSNGMNIASALIFLGIAVSLILF